MRGDSYQLASARKRAAAMGRAGTRTRANARAAVVALVMSSCVVACSSPPANVPEPDAGDLDAGVPDALAGLCPTAAATACQRAKDCRGDAGDESPPTNCAYCPPYNHALCRWGACEAPDRLEAGDVHNVSFEVGTLRPMLKSFAGILIAADTAGGARIGCQDVLAGRVDLGNTCHNVLLTRAWADISQPGDTFTLSFSLFASGQRTLFVIYGFGEEGARGSPIGVVCEELDVAAPGSGRRSIAASDKMRSIQ